jgi:hypothetical protein
MEGTLSGINNTKIIERCSKCGGDLQLWDIEIRDGYKCYRCKQTMRIILIFDPSESFRDIESAFAYSRDASLIHIAATFGVLLENRFTRASGKFYVVHVCPGCKAVQGDFYGVGWFVSCAGALPVAPGALRSGWYTV